MKFDRAETIDDVPLLRVRDFLREWRRGAFTEAHVAEFFDRRGPAARRWLQAASARGFVERSGERYRVAPGGIRLCTTKFIRRLDRAAADRLVAELLDRTEAAAAEPARWDYLVEVTGLAVFGSYCDAQASDFGDVDVLIGTRWLPELRGDRKTWSDRCWALFKRDGRHYHRIGDNLDWPDDKLRRFLRARKPHISLHNLSDTSVIETAVRVIYELPQGRLSAPRECRPSEFVAAQRRLLARGSVEP
jgi:hypothetical protein